MSRFDPFAEYSRTVLAGVWIAIAIVMIVVVTAFVVDVGAAAPDPVAYDRTAELGVSAETDETMAEEREIPKAQVFYSQFQYVVGYAGIETMVAALNDEFTEQQLGYPTVAYVQTFDGTSPDIDEEGRFTTAGSPEWTPVDEAVYVVDSGARTSAGETVIPFADRSAAEAFTAEYGGEVLQWTDLQDQSFDVDTANAVRREVPERWAQGDERIENGKRRADRPTSVVVGTDAESIDRAVELAEPNTTVVVPEGTYEETVTVEKPVTIDGRAATVRGNGTGSVITVRSPNVAISGLRISGTGNRTRDDDAVSQRPEGDEEWDRNIQLGYGYGDAGIKAVESPGLVVTDTAIETEASGILLREGSDAVIRGVRVNGTETWEGGFMGVTAMNSRITVSESEFAGGRDGIYLHRADDSVIRNSTFRDDRYGIHLMYTSDALIADNTFRDHEFGGITVMTRPEGNAIVGNDVRRTPSGIQPSGIRSYIGYNTLVHNELGLTTNARESVYEYNVLADNEMGIRATTVIPSSRLARNDFVGNDQHASAGAGPLRIWADGDHGNYWEGAYERPDRTGRTVGVDPGPQSDALDHAYRPSSPVDAALHREPAATTLAESPAMRALDALRGSVPGARAGSVIDPVPARTPYSPDRVDRATESNEPIDVDWQETLATNQTVLGSESEMTVETDATNETDEGSMRNETEGHR